MEPNLLQTKLYIPPLRGNQVSRPHLLAKIEGKRPCKLIMVSAPAGYGKTTLVTEWLSQIEDQTSICWLSLDEDENDAPQFFAYLSAAVRPLTGDDTALGQLLQSGQMVSAKKMMGAFINDLTLINAPFILVLDDYHVIDGVEIDQAVAYLLDHGPAHMTLVMSSRTDLGFPIARLRAKGELVELRANDLRFSEAEAAVFLKQHMGIDLTAEQIASLGARTEGWIAGLQMAALSMQNRDDLAGFIESFTGSHRFVMDFLLEEVLNQQPAEIQAFLLETAVLDRFCADLCDAVRPSDQTSQQLIPRIEAENMFLVSLDDERCWYRYHHLFAELLRQKLAQTTHLPTGDVPSSMADLHGRASQWYEAEGFVIDALHHASAANDVDRAFRLVEGDGVPLHLRGGAGAVLKWLDHLPPSLSQEQPTLSIMHASVLAFLGRGDVAEEKLTAAEVALHARPRDDQTDDLIGRVAAMRAMFAITHNRADIIIEQSERALEFLHPDNLTDRISAAWTLGYACQIQGDRAGARRAYEDVIAKSDASGNAMFFLGATVSLGQVLYRDNELRLAAETHKEVLEQAGDPPLPPACEGHLGLAYIYYEWNELDRAKHHAQLGYEIGREVDGVDTPAVCLMVLAYIALAERDFVEANRLAHEAERFIEQHEFAHQTEAMADLMVVLALRQNDVETAVQIGENHELVYGRARIYLAQQNYAEALALLQPHFDQVAGKGWVDERFKTAVLCVLALAGAGDDESAVAQLRELMGLAQPERFLRLFLDEGEPMGTLLHRYRTELGMGDYVAEILEAFGAGETAVQTQPLVDPLSERELEILALIEAGRKNKEIAAELFVSINTVYYHTKNIYGKLGVNSRTQAVAKGKEFGLL